MSVYRPAKLLKWEKDSYGAGDIEGLWELASVV